MSSYPVNVSAVVAIVGLVATLMVTIIGTAYLIGKRYGECKSGIDSNSLNISTLQGKLNGSLESLNHRLAEGNRELGGLTSAVESLEGSVTRIETKLDKHISEGG